MLDIGGAQNPIKGRTKSWEVGEYKILDLEMPHECKQKPDYICDLNISVASNLTIQELGWKDIGFNVAFCIEVTEYFWDPADAIQNIRFCLRKGGILYITFPFVYMSHKPEGTDFLRYTPAGVEKLLKEVGFEILEHKYRKATSDKLEQFYQEEKMKGLPGADHEIIGSMIKAKKL